MPHPSSRISGISPSGKDGWEVHFAALSRRQQGEDILMLSVGDHDFDTPSETVEACVTAVRSGHHHYTQLPGLPRLREAMARTAGEATGVPTTADEVLATPGGQSALYAAVQATLDPGDHAVVVAPYYATYPGTCRAAGADFTVVEARAEDGFQPDAKAVEAAVRPNTRAVLVNTPNNPTGAVYTRKTLEAIADICRKHDLWLFSDEVYWTLACSSPHLSPRAARSSWPRCAASTRSRCAARKAACTPCSTSAPSSPIASTSPGACWKPRRWRSCPARASARRRPAISASASASPTRS
jgi:arginine:pyruvate transaminase